MSRRSQKEKFSSKSRNYSLAKKRLSKDTKWSGILLSCLENRISPLTIAEFLSRIFLWSDKEKIHSAIADEKISLERVRSGVGPYQYMRYLDEVFTQILVMSHKEGEYHPKAVSSSISTPNKVVVAMLLEDRYDQIYQILDF